jgi:N6-adenosine-specific RNA methylase IME4
MKYNIIYADPPWNYRVWSKKGEGRSAESHYRTLTVDRLKGVDVGGISDDNSVLLMWVTFPILKEAMEVAEAWGFTYKTAAFVWVKQNKKTPSLFWGMGYYTRANAEACLLFTKGKPLKRINHDVHQVIMSPVMKHSAKPPEVRDRIVRLFGDIPRIELFARDIPEYHEGWRNVGIEITGRDINDDIEIIKNE